MRSTLAALGLAALAACSGLIDDPDRVLASGAQWEEVSRVGRGSSEGVVTGPDGSVYLGVLPLSRPTMGGALGELLGWSDASRRIEVRANAETVEAATTALSFGAQGIGLARSEHMFFSRDRMVALRRGTYTSVPIDTMMSGIKRVDVDALYDEKRYRPLIRQVDGKPMFLY